MKKKIEKIGTPLRDWDVGIYFGIKTGFNEAFIIDSQKREEILRNCENEEERKRTSAIIKPILRGRDIFKWGYKWAGLWVIVIKYGIGEEIEKNKHKWQAIFNHLSQYEEELKNRGQCRYSRNSKIGKGQHHWLELDNNPKDNYLAEFEKEKIVWQRVTQSFRFCIVPEGLFVHDSMAFLTTKDTKYLLAFLNSKLIYYYVRSYVHQYADTGFLLSNQYVERIPIPRISETDRRYQRLVSLVGQILEITKGAESYLENSQKQARIQELEKQIDQLIYELYGLTEEEIKIIEGN